MVAFLISSCQQSKTIPAIWAASTQACHSSIRALADRIVSTYVFWPQIETYGAALGDFQSSNEPVCRDERRLCLRQPRLPEEPGRQRADARVVAVGRLPPGGRSGRC